MNREFKRRQQRDERRSERAEEHRKAERESLVRGRTRTGPRQYFREIRQELRKVAWPGRKEVVSYTIVVLAATAVLTSLVFVMDFAFGRLVFLLFG